jgi:TRAP-type mannitol/chloroaromatic compound transport system permease small subunit
MPLLLQFSRTVDRINSAIGRHVCWLILLAVLISTCNALVRKIFNISSNAFLELQWYLFSGVFLLAGAHALARNAHVRIDVLSSRLSPKGQIWVDIIGLIFFLTPVCVLVIVTSWPVFMESLLTGEMSNNAGGLILWPARLLVPVGFTLLLLQGFSQLIKRVAELQGMAPVQTEQGNAISAEEALAEEIRRARGLQEAA